MILQRQLLLTVALLAFLAQTAIAREWSDATGEFKVEAELVRVEGDTVYLKKQSDGATIQVPIARLSASDRAYLNSLSSPAAEPAATGVGLELPLHTANCVGLLVVDPKPVFREAAFNQPPLKNLLDKAAETVGIDFRKLDRVTVFLMKPDSPEAVDTMDVAVFEFSTPVELDGTLSSIPIAYAPRTVAGKICHKPAQAGAPWFCVIDERTLAVAGGQEAFAKVLAATSDNTRLAGLLEATEPKNEIRFAMNLVPVRKLMDRAANAMPDGSEWSEVLGQVDTFTFIADLDGAPSIEASIQIGEGTSAADMEKKIKVGLAKLPAMIEAANEVTARQGAQGGPKPVNPAVVAQMLGGPNGNIHETLDFQHAGNSLRVSVRFPPGSPPLIQKIVELASVVLKMGSQ